VEGHLHLDGVDHNDGLREAAGESKAVTRPPGRPSTSPARASHSPGADSCHNWRVGSAHHATEADGHVRLQGLADHRALLDIGQVAALDDAVEPVCAADLLG
jgi:hypothetical protein